MDAWERYANNWEGEVQRVPEMTEEELQGALKEASWHLGRLEKELDRGRVSPKERKWMQVIVMAV